MPLQNRVTPTGEIVSTEHRGLFTGNRGIIHDPATKTLLKKRWSSPAWITCLCEFRGWRRPVMGRRSWTELFFLDEATAFADAESEALIQEALAELTRGRTVLVIAHRLSTVATADQIVVLRNGRVEDRGTHKELVERCELYRAMWEDHAASLDWSLDACSSRAAAEVAS